MKSLSIQKRVLKEEDSLLVVEIRHHSHVINIYLFDLWGAKCHHQIEYCTCMFVAVPPKNELVKNTMAVRLTLKSGFGHECDVMKPWRLTRHSILEIRDSIVNLKNPMARRSAPGVGRRYHGSGRGGHVESCQYISCERLKEWSGNDT